MVQTICNFRPNIVAHPNCTDTSLPPLSKYEIANNQSVLMEKFSFWGIINFLLRNCVCYSIEDQANNLRFTISKNTISLL